jgi:hypothetical protein
MLYEKMNKKEKQVKKNNGSTSFHVRLIMECKKMNFKKKIQGKEKHEKTKIK